MLRLEDLYRREAELRTEPDRVVRIIARRERKQAEAGAEVVWALVMGEMKQRN